MLGRALSLATVTLLIGCLTAVDVRAVENLEAGKSAAQIFSGTCAACHKSPRGLLKSVPASSLPGFLRQHYTTSSNMASLLSSYLVSNGAADTRFQAKQDKQGKDGVKDGAKDAKQEAATRPAAQQPDHRQRLPRPGETPDVMRPDHGPAQAAIDAKQGTKQKQGKKGRPEESPTIVEDPAKTEPAKTEPPAAETSKTDTAKGDDGAKPEPKSEPGETAKVDAPKESVSEPPATRPDPVPPVTPAPAVTAAAPSSPAVSSTPSETPAASSAPPAQAAQPAPPDVAAAPALPPVPPAGPPVPPISQ